MVASLLLVSLALFILAGWCMDQFTRAGTRMLVCGVLALSGLLTVFGAGHINGLASRSEIFQTIKTGEGGEKKEWNLLLTDDGRPLALSGSAPVIYLTPATKPAEAPSPNRP